MLLLLSERKHNGTYVLLFHADGLFVGLSLPVFSCKCSLRGQLPKRPRKRERRVNAVKSMIIFYCSAALGIDFLSHHRWRKFEVQVMADAGLSGGDLPITDRSCPVLRSGFWAKNER